MPSPSSSRLFIPPPSNTNPSSFMKHYPASGLTFLKPPPSIKSPSSSELSTIILINISSTHSSDDSLSSWGIFLGHNSPFNTCGLLPTDSENTKEKAEITAAIKALTLVSSRIVLGPRAVKEVVILSDSTWLIENLTSDSGLSNRKEIGNEDLVSELDDLIEEVGMTLGINVRFWHVKTAYNTHAAHISSIPLTHSSMLWSSFFESQLSSTPQSLMQTDTFLFRPSTLISLTPLIHCLTFPLTGKGTYLSYLRTFLILQTIWKTNCLPKASYSSLSKVNMRDKILQGILGANWRRVANRELERWKGKVEGQIEILTAAAKRFHESSEEEKGRKGIFVVRAEVGNHEVMGIVCQLLGLSFNFENQDEHYASLAQRYLNEAPKPILEQESQSHPQLQPSTPSISPPSTSHPHPTISTPSQISTLPSPTTVTEAEPTPKPRKSRKINAKKNNKNAKEEENEVRAERGESNGVRGESSGVRLVYQDDWVEIEYPSS